MPKSLLALCFLVLSAAPCLASGFRDFNAGISAADRGAPADAIASLTSALAAPDLPPNLRPVAYLARALAYAAQAKFDLAIVDYNQALALKSNWPEAVMDRCLTFGAMHAYDKAISDCTALVQLQPDNWRFRRFRVAIYYHQRNFEQMLSEYNSIVTARPDDVDLLDERAGVYQLMGQFDKAIYDASAAGVLVPKSFQPDQALGRIHFAEGNYLKAIESYDAAIAKAPYVAPSYLGKAQALWALGRFEEAADACRESLKRFATQPYAMMLLSVIEARLQSRVPSDILAPFAQAQLPPLETAFVQLYLGKLPPEVLLKLHGDDPGSGDDIQCPVSFHVGEWYLSQGDAGSAKRSFENAVKLCTPHSGNYVSAQLELNRVQ